MHERRIEADSDSKQGGTTDALEEKSIVAEGALVEGIDAERSLNRGSIKV
jgi:hypothetical protein